MIFQFTNLLITFLPDIIDCSCAVAVTVKRKNLADIFSIISTNIKTFVCVRQDKRYSGISFEERKFYFWWATSEIWKIAGESWTPEPMVFTFSKHPPPGRDVVETGEWRGTRRNGRSERGGGGAERYSQLQPFTTYSAGRLYYSVQRLVLLLTLYQTVSSRAPLLQGPDQSTPNSDYHTTMGSRGWKVILSHKSQGLLSFLLSCQMASSNLDHKPQNRANIAIIDYLSRSYVIQSLTNYTYIFS